MLRAERLCCRGAAETGAAESSPKFLRAAVSDSQEEIMTGALLYRQNPRWQIWAAFCGAVLLHLCAVALAKTQPASPLPALVEPEIVLEVDERSEDLPSPRIEEDPLSPPPPPIAQEAFIAEENSPTPPPIRKRTETPVQRVVRPTFTRSASSASISAARVLAVVAPRP